MLRYAQHDIRCWVNTYIIANKKDIDARINVFSFVSNSFTRTGRTVDGRRGGSP